MVQKIKRGRTEKTREKERGRRKKRKILNFGIFGKYFDFERKGKKFIKTKKGRQMPPKIIAIHLLLLPQNQRSKQPQ